MKYVKAVDGFFVIDSKYQYFSFTPLTKTKSNSVNLIFGVSNEWISMVAFNSKSRGKLDTEYENFFKSVQSSTLRLVNADPMSYSSLGDFGSQLNGIHEGPNKHGHGIVIFEDDTFCMFTLSKVKLKASKTSKTILFQKVIVKNDPKLVKMKGELSEGEEEKEESFGIEVYSKLKESEKSKFKSHVLENLYVKMRDYSKPISDNRSKMESLLRDFLMAYNLGFKYVLNYLTVVKGILIMGKKTKSGPGKFSVLDDNGESFIKKMKAYRKQFIKWELEFPHLVMGTNEIHRFINYLGVKYNIYPDPSPKTRKGEDQIKAELSLGKLFWENLMDAKLKNAAYMEKNFCGVID